MVERGLGGGEVAGAVELPSTSHLTESMAAAFFEAPVGVAMVDGDCQYEAANPAFCALVGRPLAELVGTPVLAWVHPEDLPRHEVLVRRVAAGEIDGYEIEERVLRPDGTVRWAHLRVRVERDAACRPLRRVAVVVDVTDQHLAAAALAAKEAVLTEIRQRQSQSFEHAPIGQALADIDRVLLSANPAMARLLGLAPGELVGTSLSDLTHPDDAPGDAELFDRLVSGQADSVASDKRYRHRDGHWVWAHRCVSLVRSTDGSPLYFVVQVQDITERLAHQRQLETLSEELRFSNEALQGAIIGALAGQARYRALVDHLPESVALLVDGHHRITVAGGNGAAHFGVSEQAIIGKRPGDLLAPEAASVVTRMLEEAFAGRHTSAELALTANGREELVDVVPIGDDGGDPSEVLVLARDITVRKERERALVEHSSDLTTVTDAAGQVIYASPAWETLTCRRLADAVGSQLGTLVHPDDLAMVRAEIARLVAEPGSVRSYVCRIFQAGGAVRHIEAVSANRLDNPAVGGIVTNARDVTDRVEAHQRLAHQALHDPLTDLPNRQALLDRLEQGLVRADRDGSACAVLFLDLDRFKGINDSLGHAAGDRVLRVVAERLRHAVRPTDTVGRLGGDEFVVVAEGIGDPTLVIDLAERLRATVSTPIDLDDLPVTVGCSIGIAVSARHGPEALVQEADLALYRAKERGRNRSELYDEAMHARAMRRLRTEQLIRTAVDEDGVRVAFQPIVDLATGEVVAAEALARIEVEGHVLAAPEFIPTAEDSGLIVPLGAAVLDRALGHQARWLAAGRGPAGLSVNLSARQFQHAGIVGHLARVIERHRIEPWRICLELTESALLDADDALARNLTGLKALGITLALDDFGTGWSSLTHLRRYPIDVVKVDRSFVDGLGADQGDTEVVRAIISLAHALGLTVVAEGIELPVQERLLVELGCDHGQGYRYGRPVGPHELGGLWSASRAGVTSA